LLSRDTNDPIVGFGYTIQYDSSDSWSHSYENPNDGDMIIITAHVKSGFISSINYGGVIPTLIESSADDWPQTYIYAINATTQPISGQSHLLFINWSASSSGATSFL
jgi:hypothetical protein